jgi:hypothetical protein
MVGITAPQQGTATKGDEGQQLETRREIRNR